MTSSNRPPLAALAPLAALLVAACADNFVPGSVVEDLRVLAIVAEPPQIWLPPTPTGPFQPVSLRATAVVPPAAPGGPPGAPDSETWTFCPFSGGAAAGYDCAVPACESGPLTPAADGSVTVDPIALGLACIGGPGGSLPGAPPGSGLPAQIETLVRYVATFQGQRREAVQRIPILTSAPAVPNLNPVIRAVRLGPDCAPPGVSCSVGSVAIDVDFDPGDPANFQLYPGGLGRTLQETLDVSFFTTAGRFTYEKGLASAAAPTTGTVLEARELGGASEALVWVVARDQRGGEAVDGPHRVVFSTP
jgi:hypothetical protein